MTTKPFDLPIFGKYIPSLCSAGRYGIRSKTIVAATFLYLKQTIRKSDIQKTRNISALKNVKKIPEFSAKKSIIHKCAFSRRISGSTEIEGAKVYMIKEIICIESIGTMIIVEITELMLNVPNKRAVAGVIATVATSPTITGINHSGHFTYLRCTRPYTAENDNRKEASATI
jgi:hypothetical protein